MSAVLVGLALAPVALYALGVAAVVLETRLCDDTCEDAGGWQFPGF